MEVYLQYCGGIISVSRSCSAVVLTSICVLLATLMFAYGFCRFPKLPFLNVAPCYTGGKVDHFEIGQYPYKGSLVLLIRVGLYVLMAY